MSRAKGMKEAKGAGAKGRKKKARGVKKPYVKGPGRKKYQTFDKGRADELKAKKEARKQEKELKVAEAMAHQINDGRLKIKFAHEMSPRQRRRYALDRRVADEEEE